MLVIREAEIEIAGLQVGAIGEMRGVRGQLRCQRDAALVGRVNLAAAGHVPSMTTDILNSLELTIPSSDVLATFENMVSPMYSIMQHNARESTKLEKLRDSLLPKLMNGEIEYD